MPGKSLSTPDRRHLIMEAHRPGQRIRSRRTYPRPLENHLRDANMRPPCRFFGGGCHTRWAPTCCRKKKRGSNYVFDRRRKINSLRICWKYTRICSPRRRATAGDGDLSVSWRISLTNSGLDVRSRFAFLDHPGINYARATRMVCIFSGYYWSDRLANLGQLTSASPLLARN